MVNNKFTYKKHGQKTAKRQGKKNRTFKNKKQTYLARGGLLNTLNSGLYGATSFLKSQQANAQANLQPGQEQPPHIQMFGYMSDALGQLQNNINQKGFQEKVGEYGNKLNQHLQTAQQSAQNIYEGAQNGQFGEGVKQHLGNFQGSLNNAKAILGNPELQRNLGSAGKGAMAMGKNLGTFGSLGAKAFSLANQGKLTRGQSLSLLARGSYTGTKLAFNAGRTGLGVFSGVMSAANSYNKINQQRQPQMRPGF